MSVIQDAHSHAAETTALITSHKSETNNISTNIAAQTSASVAAPEPAPAAQDDDDRFIVKFRQQFYDISEFMRKHPGGINTLRGLNKRDMTSRFLKAPPHSDAALYLLREYKVKDETESEHMSQDATGAVQRRKGMPRNGESGIELIEEEDTNNNQLDESMEHLVDWSKAMVPQIPRIVQYYDAWVHKPVDRPLRLFGPWYLEMCTKTPWWVIPLFWLPVIYACVSGDFANSWQQGNKLKLLTLSVLFATGILIWTLVEYALHRWVFHMKTNANTNPWLCTFHFMIHGLHHKVPFDPQRLVFPPLPGVLIASILYTPLSFVLPEPRIVLGGALVGYLCYDMMHYYLHYGNPTLKHLYHMKRYHYQHHFAHQDKGYGISSPLWDLVFSTRIQLRKLRFQIRWN